jgi:hypothetical protein
MKVPEFSAEEKSLLASLEPIIRNAVWGSTSSNGQYAQPGKWIEYSLRHPQRVTPTGKHLRVTLKPENSTEDFLECYSAFGASHLHTAVAVYRILRELKKRGLLQIPGFECGDVRPASKNKD